MIVPDLVNTAKDGEADKADLARKNGIEMQMKLPVSYLRKILSGRKQNGRICSNVIWR